MLYDDFFVVVAGAQNPWVRRRKIELAELVNESWVLPPPESMLGVDRAWTPFVPAVLTILARRCSPLPPDVRISLSGDWALSYDLSRLPY